MGLGDWKLRSGLLDELCVRNVCEGKLSAVGTYPREPTILWLGHASFRIDWHGLRILVDPVFSAWIGPFPRLVPAPDVKLLEDVDVALVSHGHMDHLDNRSLGLCSPKRIVIPRNTERFLSWSLQREVQVSPLELDEEIRVGSLTIRALYARHGGWRYPWQRSFFACSFLISDGVKNLFVCGDSAYGSHFGEIGKRWKIDTALLPVGAYSPQWFLKSRHLNPEEAVQAFFDLGAERMVPCHFGSYRLSWEPVGEPLKRFARCAESEHVSWCLPLGIE